MNALEGIRRNLCGELRRKPLDLGGWKVVVRARLGRLACRPCRRVLVEAVPFARHRSRFVADFG